MKVHLIFGNPICYSSHAKHGPISSESVFQSVARLGDKVGHGALAFVRTYSWMPMPVMPLNADAAAG